LNTRETPVVASPIAQNAQGVRASPPSKWRPKPTEPDP
jgi:hypothetical protein